MRGRAACSSAAAIALVAAIALAGACRKPEAPPPPPAPYATVRPFAPVARRAAPAIPFADVTASSGIAFVHDSGASERVFLPETMGAGVAIFDHDGDGLPDLLFVQGCRVGDRCPPAALYRNLGGMRFEDVTARSGIPAGPLGMGAAVADADGDGDPDVVITALGRPLLLRNDGGTFRDVAARAGVTGGTWVTPSGKEVPSWGTSAAWLDHDADGRLDLFIASYVRWSPETDVFTTLDGVHKAFTTPTSYAGDTCRLYRNLGDWRFEDVTDSAGIRRDDAKALGVVAEDVNGDGRPDIVVANDTQPNFLYLSRPEGGFVESALRAGIAYDEGGRARAGMGVDMADVDGSGRRSLAIGNFSREPLALFQPDAQGFFVDRAAACGLAGPTLLTLTFGLAFFDADLDGWPDLALANGHIEPNIAKVQADVSHAQAPQLFWGRGDGTFADASALAGEVFSRPVVARGLATADLDGDGDLDLVLTTCGGPPLILRNDQALGHHWLRVRLSGRGGNRDALGARVVVSAGGRDREQVVRAGSSYLSQSELVLTFGLGEASVVDGVRVRWPDGAEERFAVESVDALVVLEQGSGTAG